MAERLVELIRQLAAKNSSDPISQELLSLVGEDGDPHETNQRHPSGESAADVPADSTRNSKVWDETDGDTRIAPGEGVYVSRIHADMKDWRRKDHNGIFIPQAEILDWAHQLEARTKMAAMAQRYRDQLAKRQKTCHPGTDAEDGAKHRLHRTSDDSRVDQSQSSIYIGVTSSTGTWLNGSAVQHQRFIHIGIQTPDGRRCCDVYLSMDQFAAALVSNGHVPCTVDAYWSMGHDAVLLRERVRPPPSIADRMQNRVKHRFEEKFQWMRECIDSLEKSADVGKSLSKTAQAQMAQKLKLALEHLSGTADYAVEQSLEEVASIVETAAIHIAQTHQVPLEALMGVKAISSLLSTALPAPKKSG